MKCSVLHRGENEEKLPRACVCDVCVMCVSSGVWSSVRIFNNKSCHFSVVFVFSFSLFCCYCACQMPIVLTDKSGASADNETKEQYTYQKKLGFRFQACGGSHVVSFVDLLGCSMVVLFFILAPFCSWPSSHSC